MNCPYCKSDTAVVNSRSSAAKQSVWRRRQCKTCKEVWTTRENYDLASTHTVKYPSQGDIQAFSRDILLFSIRDSLQHSKTAEKDAGHLTDTVITKLIKRKKPTFTTTEIKEKTTQILKAYDKVAAAVYSATYKS